MKFLSLILITFLMNACSTVQPGTYDGAGTFISGKVVDSITMKSIRDVSISEHIKTYKNGNFYIPKYTKLNISTLKDGPWGSHRYFIVSKKGYTPQLCVCDMRHTDAYALIRLVPKGKKVQRSLIDVGPNVSCMPFISENLKG